MAPDHDADAYKPEVEPSRGLMDGLLRSILDGFNKWDSKHILHVAEHGYDSEHSFAFFPLFPFIVRMISNILVHLLPFLTFHTCCVVAAVGFNCLAFVGSAMSLFDMTLNMFGDVPFAVLSSVAFCFNPASIFFSACYTESLYALCVFKALNHLFNRQRVCDGSRADFLDHLNATLWFVLGSLTRANGTVNMGFIIHSYMWYFIADWKRKKNLNNLPSYLTQCVLFCGVIALSFVFFNLYGFMKFCQGSSSGESPMWCLDEFPSIYNHIQKENWGLGLFAYYQLRKTPNFILAAPVLVISIHSSFLYLHNRKNEIVFLGFPFIVKNKREKIHNLMFINRNIFCFIVHLCFLVGFAALFMHIEVTTRMIASSSPILYWIAGSYLYRDLMPSKSPLLLSQTWQRLSFRSKLIISYFLSYIVLGVVSHANFLPWT